MSDFYFPPRSNVDVAQLCRQLVQIPSVNPMGGSIDMATCYEGRVTDYLEILLRKWGLRTERQRVESLEPGEPVRENILATFAEVDLEEESASDRPILLYEVHQDTVPVTGMTIAPWGGEIREGRVWGRGACDVKGGMASMLVAMARLAELPAAKRPRIVLACTVNEEHGFTGAQQLAGLFQSGDSHILPHAPDLAIVAEPTQLQVVVAHKGTVRWKCITRGRAAHSSAPQNGRNAIYAMAHVLPILQRYAEEVVGTLGEHPRLSCPTLSVGLIQGGVSVNTVPDCCTIDVDRRLLPHELPAEAHQHIATYIRQHLPPHLELEIQPPWLTARGLTDENNGRLAQMLSDAAQTCGVRSASIGVPYGTDASTFAACGVPTVVFGPGDVAQAHTADEWIEITQLEAAANIYTQFALAARADHQNTSRTK